MKISRRVIVPAFIALVGCGGGGGGSDVGSTTRRFTGTLAGSDCFTSAPASANERYDVTFEGFEPGDEVTLIDAAGNVWQGTMTSSSGFEVTRPEADARFKIVAAEIGPRDATFSSTESCVSFRCCTTLSGSLNG